MRNYIEALKDRNDFEQTTLPHMDILHSYALHLTRNSEDAKDLVQDVLLKAFRFWDKYEKGTNVKAWLYRIMRNSYINQYRSKTKEPHKIDFDDNRFYSKASQHEGLLEHKDAKPYHEIFEDEIAHSLDTLTKDFKTIVLLSDLEKFSYQEIAKIMNCPVGTVRSRLHRGRKQLQKKLFAYASDNRYILQES
jgi:RNA polymerase sigma-70 factor, ECF subfamily